MTLLEKFADPNVISSMSFGEKMLATLYTTILGMGITFAALVVIWGTTTLMSKIIRGFEEKNKPEIVKVSNTAKPAAEAVKVEEKTDEEEDDEELIAVISAAIAASLNTSIHNIVVRNIVRVDDRTPAWGKAGIIEQMNSRF